jgi:hypothetical protein
MARIDFVELNARNLGLQILYGSTPFFHSLISSSFQTLKSLCRFGSVRFFIIRLLITRSRARWVDLKVVFVLAFWISTENLN